MNSKSTSLRFSDPNISIELPLTQVQMDNIYIINDSKPPKRSSLSPIQNFGTQNPYYNYKTPVIDQYASPDRHTTAIKTPTSPFLRYLQSARSLSSSPPSIGDLQASIGYKYHRGGVSRPSENSPRLEPSVRSRSPLVFGNKVEEDVLVMDGVVVKNPVVERGRSSSSPVTESGDSSSSSSSLSPGGKIYKMELCLSYLENAGYCRYGTKCQFAHGNKELRASKLSYKSTLETPCKSYNISTPSSSSTVPKTPSPTHTTSPTKIHQLSETISNLKTTDWSPFDDGIDIHHDTLSKEDFDTLINNFFNGPKKSQRLLVFIDICPE